jgi:hypothetical protein
MSFIDLSRKLIGKSTVYNLSVGLSDGSGESLVLRSKRNCCYLCSFSCSLDRVVISKNHLL